MLLPGALPAYASAPSAEGALRWERRRVSMLHEYGHLMIGRFKPGIDYLTYRRRKFANEGFAETFALGFLMPASSVQQRFNATVAATGDFQVADLCRLSHFYFVSGHCQEPGMDLGDG